MSRAVAFLVLGSWVVGNLAQADEGKLARVWFAHDRSVVGPMKTIGDSVVITDLKTLQERTFAKHELLKTDPSLTDNQAAELVGLQAVVAYRIGQRTADGNKSGRALGKVAQVTPTAIYVSLGKDRGASVGQKLAVYRLGAEIKDPDTGKVLTRERPKVAELEVFETAEGFSKGKILGNIETVLQTGDEVEAEVPRLMVAVFPLVDESGRESPGSTVVREQLVTALVKQNIPVVERSRLDSVIAEQAVQNFSPLFDPAQAQKFGKLLGAGMIVAGKITTVGDGVEGHLRLVSVATGEVLYAISGKLPDAPKQADFVAKPAAADKDKLKELMQVARGGDRDARGYAIKELGDTKDPAAAKFLAEEMLEREPFKAADALESMGSVAADPLIRVIQTGNLAAKGRSMKIFVKVAEKKHIPVLQAMMADIHLRRDAERTILRLQNE